MPISIDFYFDWTTALVVTVILFGFLSHMTGATLARNWRSFAMLVGFCALLAVGERFMAHAIVWERFYVILDVYWSPEEGVSFGFDTYYFISFLVSLASASFAYYATRASLMVRQYPWLYERAGPVGWRLRRSR